MDIDDVELKKYELQTKISEVVSGLVEQFKLETGISPRSIDISMEPVIQIGVPRMEHVVGLTKIDIEI